MKMKSFLWTSSAWVQFWEGDGRAWQSVLCVGQNMSSRESIHTTIVKHFLPSFFPNLKRYYSITKVQIQAFFHTAKTLLELQMLFFSWNGANFIKIRCEIWIVFIYCTQLNLKKNFLVDLVHTHTIKLEKNFLVDLEHTHTIKLEKNFLVNLEHTLCSWNTL